MQSIWRHYFNLVGVAQRNAMLSRTLMEANNQINRQREIELSHARIEQLLEFKSELKQQMVAAAVVGKDPSPWFKTVIIDKGHDSGVQRGMPVVTPSGIAGLVMDVSSGYAKVLLIEDQNSAVDALVQDTRARGIIKGEPSGRLSLYYVLRRHNVARGQIIISSGLDGVFPKGLQIGFVHAVNKPNSGVFQEVFVTPFVDFEKLEEVLVIIDVPKPVEFSDS
jgi:rod shape-determining protein MreC